MMLGVAPTFCTHYEKQRTMKLKTGVYDQLINGELADHIKASEEQGLVCQTERIDSAESPKMLAHYVSDIIRRRLEDSDATEEERLRLMNRIIRMAEQSAAPVVETDGAHATANELTDVKEKLAAVMTQRENSEAQLTGTTAPRPLSGFRVSNLFTGGQSALSLHDEIKRDIASADEICLIVSFLKMSGVRTLRDELAKFCAHEHHRLRIITTTYCRVTELKAVKMLAALPRTEIRVSYNARIERLHAKSYIFLRHSGFSTAYIGSSNLSRTAHTDGLEWNIRVTNVENPHIIKSAVATFETYWNSPNFEPFDEQQFLKAMDDERRQWDHAAEVELYQRYTLLPHQKKILEKIRVERDVHGLRRNLVVAATGTGKTVISAFDYRHFVQQQGQRGRLLFIAHREEILKQSRSVFRSVLGDYNFGDLMVGRHRSEHVDHLFVSIQTLNSRWDDFRHLGAGYYDYIVVDEAHHMAADSYQRAISFFEPSILMGLTATPERMDGASLLPDFGGKISAEIRLPQALDEGLLTPFQYLCITDATDLTGDDLWEGNKYVVARLSERLCTEERAALVVNKLREYLPDENACKALGFCCNKRHAEFMATQLRRYGMKADYLTADSSDDHRRRVNSALAEGRLNYLFVVDIFNEGVDIPEVDTVLFLRPTESLTIFLQQLGRGLRLSVGKDVLTVMDFVAQVNRKYDFAGRFRALLTRRDVNIGEQVAAGFTCLPQGCTIYMEEMARRVVVENIRGAIYNLQRLRRELAAMAGVPTLTQFLNSNGQDIRLIYRGNNCWTTLKRDAGKCAPYRRDAITARLEKGMGRLVHLNSAAQIRFVLDFIHRGALPAHRNDEQQARAVMLYYALFQDRLSRTDFSSIEEALESVFSYPLFVQEMREIMAYLSDRLAVETFAVGSGMPVALEQYGCYTREEVFTIFGIQTPERKMQGSVAGVFRVEEVNAELFFVTLNKSDKDFSPSTQYNDYVVSEDLFHWQSQNTDSHSGSGRRFVEQRRNGRRFVLFVRENKRDGYGNTCPFYCFGLVDYLSSSGDYPMSIEWRLQQKALPEFVKAV